MAFCTYKVFVPLVKVRTFFFVRKNLYKNFCKTFILKGNILFFSKNYFSVIIILKWLLALKKI